MEDAPLPNKYSISVNSDKNNKFEIEFTNEENCLLILSKFNNDIYQDKIQLSEIKLNKYFSICDSIYDVLFTLKQCLLNTKLQEINNELILTIFLNHPLAKEIQFFLKKKLLNDNPNNNSELIQNLTNLVNSLSLKIDSQQKEIDSLKQRITILEKNNSSQKIQSTIKEEKPLKNENNFNNDLSNSNRYYFSKYEYSNIIRTEIEDISIRNWIHGMKTIIKFKLLYRMSRDGTSSLDFHSRCDNQGKTLVLIETKNGKRIGGYTPLQWNSGGGFKCGINIWIFTLDGTMYRYPLMKPGQEGSINCCLNNGPSFEEGITFRNNTLSVGYIEHKGLMNASGITDKKIEIKEIEVFQVYIKY